jgi:beta-galactosidase
MNKSFFRLFIAVIILLHVGGIVYAQAKASAREKIEINQEWKFALGHATDAGQDYNHGTGYFSYFAKTGYGDGPAARDFDDRPWRVLNLPHDWCVELPFAADGSHSHGYWAIGRNYPENSVGWYRKHFMIAEKDLGKKISIEFDGVHRDAQVWVNGFYLGTQESGYASHVYDITDYLNYGGNNVIAVRVDVTMEEGWYYEGAGIVRSVWLLKTAPLHVARYGTFVTTELEKDKALVKTRTTIENELIEPAKFDIKESLQNGEGKVVASGLKRDLVVDPGAETVFYSGYAIENPELWSLEDPTLHKLITTVLQEGKIVDEYETTFGIRTVRFDPDSGFFLNGENIKILGTNLHQDHAGVGRAIPPKLHEYRIRRMQDMGSNAVRTSHDPPDPAFLDACDRLGFLVLDENRLMGINREHLDLLENLIKRDRNHPSVVIWSLGNEEWAIEGNITGARIATTMQNFANRLDSSRAFTAACSGGWDNGIGTVTQVIGYNYLWHGDIDAHHEKFPWQAGIGTEESNTIGTRGIYFTHADKCHLAYINDGKMNLGAETGWKYYAEKPFLSGLFYWTGIDYRGEPTPYAWPAVTSQFGVTDLCAFPKDIFFYFRSWWDDKEMVHICPHWNWQGKEGDTIPVVVYSNFEEVELFLNEVSLGKKAMPINGHLQWNVAYAPGKLEALGMRDGQVQKSSKVVTSGEPASVKLSANRQVLKADQEDVAIITVRILDAKNKLQRTANRDLEFTIEGPGRIIGVGNGNPSSHEPEQYVRVINTDQIDGLMELPLQSLQDYSGNASDYSGWRPAFPKPEPWQNYQDSLIAVRGQFELPEISEGMYFELFSKSIVEKQSIYINGELIASDIARDAPGQAYPLDPGILKEGVNEYTVLGQRFRLQHKYDEPNTDPGVVQIVYPEPIWKRKTFNGLAQVLVQSTDEEGVIVLRASSEELGDTKVEIKTTK